MIRFNAPDDTASSRARRTCRRLTCGLAGAFVLAAGMAQAFAQGMFGGEEQKVVKQFDKNGDGRLDSAERKIARVSLSGNGGQGGFGRRAFGRFARTSSDTGPGRRLAPADVKTFPKADLYDTTSFRTLFLRFDDEDWESELEAFYNTDVEVPAAVTVDGQTFPDVGVHFRGASSYRMVPEGVKRSLNLTFDFVHEDQRLRGYRTLNLLNANGDATLVRTLLYAEIARHYLPTPRTNYVRVVINGESWGTYLNAQQFNSDFTRDFFSATRGARWKVPGSPRGQGGMEYFGENLAPYKRLYEIKTKDDAKSWADLIHMFRVLNETPAEKLEAALAPLLDIDGVLKFLALEVALVNSDGYWTRASDYSIYQDPQGRFHVIPHDVNEALAEGGGGFGFGGGGVNLDPLVGLNDTSKPLRSRLLAVPALRARYLSYVRDIAGSWLDWQRLDPLVTQYQRLIADEVKVDTRKLYSFEAFQSGVSGLRSFVDRRRAFLLQSPR